MAASRASSPSGSSSSSTARARCRARSATPRSRSRKARSSPARSRCSTRRRPRTSARSLKFLPQFGGGSPPRARRLAVRGRISPDPSPLFLNGDRPFRVCPHFSLVALDLCVLYELRQRGEVGAVQAVELPRAAEPDARALLGERFTHLGLAEN